MPPRASTGGQSSHSKPNNQTRWYCYCCLSRLQQVSLKQHRVAPELETGNYPGQFTDQSMTLSQLCPLPPELVWMQLKTETCSGAEPELVSSVLDAQSSDSQLFQVTERSDRRRKLHQTVVVQIPERKRDTWEMTNWEYLLWTGTVSLDWD